VLVASFLKEALEHAELQNKFTMAVIQTAYANGATTKFYQDLGLTIAKAKTGVKHLHEEAEKFDIGLYCESNGHGTCIFSQKFIAHLREMITWGLEDTKTTAARRLLAVNDCLNQAVGDATSMMLLSEAILAIRGWEYEQWDQLYTELPSRLAKIDVEDKNVIETTDDDSEVTSPPELQQKLRELIASTPQGRCFVRPSGTENIVRVYAEAETQKACDDLCLKALQEVHALCKGTGRRPNKL